LLTKRAYQRTFHDTVIKQKEMKAIATLIENGYSHFDYYQQYKAQLTATVVEVNFKYSVAHWRSEKF